MLRSIQPQRAASGAGRKVVWPSVTGALIEANCGGKPDATWTAPAGESSSRPALRPARRGYFGHSPIRR